MTLLHQKGALSHEISYRANLELNKKIPLDISRTNQIIIINPFQPINNIKYIVFNNTDDVEEVIRFDSDSVNLYINSCITGGLTVFKSVFIEGSYVEIPERSTNTTAGKTTIISEGIAAYRFIDDKGEPFTLYTKMLYAPQSKYRLIQPQWIGIKEREKGVPKNKTSKCNIHDEEAIFYINNQ